MSIRLHLTAQDVTNIRLVAAPSVLLEVQSAALCCRPGGRGSPRRLGRPELDHALAVVGAAVGYHGCTPGFLSYATTEADEAWEAIRAASAAVAAEDLAHVQAQTGTVPRALRRLVDPAGPDRAALLAAFRRIHRGLVQPADDAAQAVVQAHRRWIDRTVRTDGLGAVLGALGPTVVWRPPVLELRLVSAVDLDVSLQGQGLALYPSLYQTGVSVQHDPGTGGTWVTYPLGRARGSRPAGPGERTGSDAAYAVVSALGPALGDTRAALLAELARRPGRGTTALAERMGVAASTSSDHLAALRRAGLVRTERRGPAVAHHLTEMGWSLVHAATDVRTGRS